MRYSTRRVAFLGGLLASTALVSAAGAHTISIGYENAGPGSVTFWYGSYHTGTNYNEGSLNLTGPGVNQTVPFDLLTATKPGGLIDGTTNFYTDGQTPPSLIATEGCCGVVTVWQGSTFSGLKAGTYTFTYLPIANPTANWAPWDDAILSSIVTLSGAIVGGGIDAGIMATEGAVALEPEISALREVIIANAKARKKAAEKDGGIVSSMNGNSDRNFSVWGRVGGGTMSADFGGHLEVSHFYSQVGVEMRLIDGLAAGISMGGGTISADTSTASLDGDLVFVRPYAAFLSGPLTVVGSIGYTYTNYDDSTDTINSGDRFSGALEGSYMVPISDGTNATPFGLLSIGTEKFSGTPGDNFDFMVGRAGVELSHDMDLLNTGTMHVYGSFAGEYVSTNQPNKLGVSLLTNYDDSRLGGRVEAGFNFTISGTSAQMFASVHGSGLFTQAPGIGGEVGLKLPF